MNQFEIINEETDGREYLQSHNITKLRTIRSDLHAFLLLDELFPSEFKCDIISGAAHDVIYLNISDKNINEISYKHALELTRCGVIYNDYGLYMNV